MLQHELQHQHCHRQWMMTIQPSHATTLPTGISRQTIRGKVSIIFSLSLSFSLRRTRRSYRCAGEGGGGGGGKGDHHLTMAHPPDAHSQCVSLAARNILSVGTEWPAEAPAKQWTAVSLTLSLRHYGHQSLQSLIYEHCVQRRCRAQQPPQQPPSSRLPQLYFAQRSLLQSQ